jgi:hypothetical protein
MTTLADANTAPTGIAINPSLGRQAAALTRSVNLSNEDYTALQQLATLLSGTLTVTANVGSGTQPVSGTITANAGTGTMAVAAAALPLPTGAATAANQTALTALFPTSLGTKTAANSLAVTLASDGPFVTSIGAPADTSATTDTGTFSLIALIKRAVVYLGNISGAALDTTTASPVKIDQTTPGTTDAVTIKSPADVISFTPTLDTAAYAAGDVLFATAAISGVTRANDLRSALMSLTAIDKSKNKPAFTLFFYQTNVTSAAANAANNLSDADAVNCLGFVRVASTDWIDLANNSFACLKGINLLLEAATGTTTVYVIGILDAGTPTFAVGDLVLKLGVVQS